jgi:hypothetical protein
MIPFRSVFLALGFADEDIHWNSATRTISATKGTVTVSFTIDQKQVTVLRDGDAVTTPTDVAPYLDPETNRTYARLAGIDQDVIDHFSKPRPLRGGGAGLPGGLGRPAPDGDY